MHEVAVWLVLGMMAGLLTFVGWFGVLRRRRWPRGPAIIAAACLGSVAAALISAGLIALAATIRAVL